MRQWANVPSYVISSESMHLGVLATAWHAIQRQTIFTVYYKPRTTPAEFIIPYDQYMESIKNNYSIGMSFNMRFEGEEAPEQRFTGTIVGIEESDPNSWPESKWGCLQVQWDETSSIPRRERVSPWQIEPALCPPAINPLPVQKQKRPQSIMLPSSPDSSVLTREVCTSAFTSSIIMPFATATDKESTPSTSSTQPSVPCYHFDFSEILVATEYFSESFEVGSGGFGKVYKGNITNGSSVAVVAIKRLDSMSDQGAAEFWAEIKMLSMLRHCNLVSLIGYCNYEKEMILVYEYMPNGTLDGHLHKLHTPLSWLQRLKICIGAGRGLHYLHTGTGIQSGVIHRDVKSSNILLDESWAAKISDFGLSKIGPTNQPSTYVNTLIKGTFGYLDPDYFTTGRLTRKSDVYAFGVVLLEVLTRKRAVDRSLDEEQWGLVTWAQDYIKEGNLKHIIDSDIRCEISPKCLKEYVRVAERCLHNNPKQRPTMAEVVVSLEYVLTVQEKINNSFQARGKTIFGRMVDMLRLPSIN